MPIIARDENGSAINRIDVRTRSVPFAASTSNSTNVKRTESNDDDDDDTPMTVGKITTEYTIKLGISSAHTKWTPSNAFQELARSWRDSILATHRLPESKLCIQKFKTPAEKEAVEIVFVATEQQERHGNDGQNNSSCSNDGSSHNEHNNNDRLEECLGYIRYSCSTKDSYGNFRDGTVDLVSRGAVLQPWHFDLRASHSKGHKDKNKEETSIYCEKLPLVFIALMRDEYNHNIVCTSGGLLWTGNHSSNGRPVVHLQRLPEDGRLCTHDEHVKIKMSNMHLPQTVHGAHKLFDPDTDTDVHISIGETRRAHCAHRPCVHSVFSRDESGKQVDRRGVALDNFTAWTTTVLFLARSALPADSIVQTPAGDLLLAPQLGSLRYCNDILLCDKTVRGRRYGYNFHMAGTTRGRTWLVSPFLESFVIQESFAIAKIWRSAIEQRPNLALLFHKMLQHEMITAQHSILIPALAVEPCAEVRYIQYIDGSVLARQMWQHLRGISLAEGSAADNDSADHHCDHSKDRQGGIWYYSEQDSIANPQLPALISAQNRRGVHLTDCYWKLLRRYCNVYTWSEMEQHVLISAPIVAIGLRVDARLHGPVTITCPTAMAASHAAVSPSAFQTDLIRLLHASFLGAEQTRTAGFVFVQPTAKSSFDMAYMDRCRTFYIHANWLDLNMTASKLGFTTGCLSGGSHGRFQTLNLLGEAQESSVLFYAVKTLFTWALERSPKPSVHGVPEWPKNKYGEHSSERDILQQYVVRAEMRLLDYFSLVQGPSVVSQDPTLNPSAEQKVKFTWLPALFRRETASIAVQCHRQSCTVRGYAAELLRRSADQPIRKVTLLARDLNACEMPCLRSTESSAPDASNVCSIGYVSKSSPDYIVAGTVPGESYFFVVVVNPQDEYAIASVTDIFTIPEVTVTDGVETAASASITDAMPSARPAASPTASHHRGPAVPTASTGAAQSGSNIYVAGGADETGQQKRRRVGQHSFSATIDAGRYPPTEESRLSDYDTKLEKAPLKDYQVQLMLLEGQNKRRLAERANRSKPMEEDDKEGS